MIHLNETFYDTIKNLFFTEACFIRTYKSHSDWIEKKYSINSDILRHHFNGDYYIGPIQRKTPTHYFCFDLDTYSDSNRSTINYRFHKIIEQFRYPHLTVRTPSGGLHLYYFLDKPKYHYEIRNCIGSKIRLKKGEIELFPSNNGLRLFGGKNCPLLNHKFNILAKTPQAIAGYFEDLIHYSDPIILEDFYDGKIEKYTNFFIREVEDLMKFGLQEPSTRNNALIKINWYLRTYKGYNKDEAKRYMISWIEKKNNGQSKDWNRNKSGVIKQIEKIAEGYDATKINAQHQFPIHLLSEKNIINIKEFSSMINKKNKIDALKLESFLADLVAYCREKNKNGIVEIPRKVFQKCQFGSGTRYIDFKKVLIQHGILKIEMNYSTISHKSIRYRILDKLIL